MDTSDFEKWIAMKESKRKGKSVRKAKAKSGKPGRSKFKSKHKPGFSAETREAANKRAEGRCENPLCQRELPDLGGEHHCLPRSQYSGDDRNDLWNCAHICSDCHYRITNPTTDEDKRLRRYFERIAIARRMGDTSKSKRKIRVLEKKLKNGTLDVVRRFEPFTK